MAPTNFQDIMNLFIGLIAKAMGLLFAAAFAAFFYGIVIFISNSSVDAKRTEGKAWMMWSVVALFVMFTLWGIVGVLVNTFNLSPLLIPQLPSSS